MRQNATFQIKLLVPPADTHKKCAWPCGGGMSHPPLRAADMQYTTTTTSCQVFFQPPVMRCRAAPHVVNKSRRSIHLLTCQCQLYNHFFFWPSRVPFNAGVMREATTKTPTQKGRLTPTSHTRCNGRFIVQHEHTPRHTHHYARSYSAAMNRV